MAQFAYRAVDPQGKVFEGTLEAGEVAAVVARLHDRGLIPLGISAAAGERTVTNGRAARVALPSLKKFGRRGVGRSDLLVMTQELSVLVSAGLPLDRSLTTLVELADNPELKRILGEVVAAVQGGKSFSEALGEHSVFPPLYVNMVRAGEAGGFMEQVLQRLAEYLERAQMLVDEVRAALAYPVLLTLAMGGSLIFLLVFVLPRFQGLFADLGRALPMPARIVLGMSEIVRSYWWIVGLLGVGAFFGFRRSISTPRGRLRWDQIKLRLPLLGAVLRKMEVASLTRTLGTLLRSGVPMLQALAIGKEVAGNQVISRALGEVEAGAREGAGIADPLARTGGFPQLALQMIAVGEETGKLD